MNNWHKKRSHTQKETFALYSIRGGRFLPSLPSSSSPSLYFPHRGNVFSQSPLTKKHTRNKAEKQQTRCIYLVSAWRPCVGDFVLVICVSVCLCNTVSLRVCQKLTLGQGRLNLTQGVFNSIRCNPSTAISDAQGKCSIKQTASHRDVFRTHPVG